MPLTPYHAKFYAYEFSRVGGEGVDRLGGLAPCVVNGAASASAVVGSSSAISVVR